MSGFRALCEKRPAFEDEKIDQLNAERQRMWELRRGAQAEAGKGSGKCLKGQQKPGHEKEKEKDLSSLYIYNISDLYFILAKQHFSGSVLISGV